MKILIADSFEWQEAKRIGENMFLTNGGSHYKTSDIISVSEDNNKSYKKCNGCGAIIPNNPSAIKKHITEHKSPKGCLTCSLLSEYRPKVLKKSYKLLENGTYEISTKESATLVCKNNRDLSEINLENGRKYCKFRDCTKENIVDIEDFWTQYPGAFDEMAAIDSISNPKGFEHQYTDYEIKVQILKRPAIWAYVNVVGAIYKFRVDTKYNCYQLRYSKKYNELFRIVGPTYKKFNPENDYISAEMYKKVFNAISKLYK